MRYKNEKCKRKTTGLIRTPDWCNPSDNPPHPAKMSREAKDGKTLGQVCSSIGSSDSIAFPFLLAIATSSIIDFPLLVELFKELGFMPFLGSKYKSKKRRG